MVFNVKQAAEFVGLKSMKIRRALSANDRAPGGKHPSNSIATFEQLYV